MQCMCFVKFNFVVNCIKCAPTEKIHGDEEEECNEFLTDMVET